VKLQTKLILAFISIVLLMGISQSLFLQSKIENTFQGYLEKNNIGYMEKMKQNLELYYQETGSWSNVQEKYFTNSYSTGHGMMMRGMSANMGISMANADLLLLDMQGTVIADTANTRIGITDFPLSGKKEDLIINGEKKGTLLLYQYELQNLEKDFINSTNMAILISSLIGAFLSIVISVWIARKMTTPLKALIKGTKKIASSEKVEIVNIQTKDEFRELGEAFNEMSQMLAKNEEVRKALVADVAHELRTPLTILQGKLESIQEGAIQASEEVILEITDEVYRLKRLVNDLQQLSLAESGNLPLHIMPVNINQLVDKVGSHFQWLADEKEINLSYAKIPDDVLLNIDADRITQVIVNLVGNALRHTPEKGMVELIGEESGDSFILKVADNGPGIPPDDLPFIFDRFYKRDPSRSRTDGGTGLGLSIAKGYVEAHGGMIEVKSKVNKGTTFIIKLKK
jgi:two-component system sensor histidine kinase BaeS